MNRVARFLTGLIGMTLAVMAITLFLIKAGVISPPSFLNATLLVMTVSTGLIFLFLERTHPQQPLDFVRNFMLTLVLKIILSGFYVFIFLQLDPASANANVAFFIVNYFLFTAYEITWFAVKKNAE